MRVLDFAYVDLHADSDDWSDCQAGVDLPADVRLIGYCVVAERGPYLVAVKGGRYHVARQTPYDQFDGVHYVQTLELDIAYSDDDDIVTPTAGTWGPMPA